MTRPDKDEEREERIHMEIIVDAYGPEEQATSWYTYLFRYLAVSVLCPLRCSPHNLAIGARRSS
ncbi:hypothetical protein KSC_109530 [Ktedonobacter sp. SOSP1-52]|uniref:calcium-binding protein n=1 Tax=Ktedonobacter sp. SOSP1-52 TaxID=2778366 RepID=UPI001A343350|nr:calcium-binding protein [Ktedonobacter sp. SOSP1-52]GHO72061.1 hypothetical protein KSC_109530 [Ktedonobacter sp. SOSP1-52]